MTASISYRLNEAEARLKALAEALHSASPLSVLAKGYAVCRDENGKVLRNAASLKVGQNIKIGLRDGEADALVKNISLSEGLPA